MAKTQEQLTKDYVHLLWTKVRFHTKEMIDAYYEWQRRSDEINDFIERSGITDIGERNNVRGVNLGLQGAYSRWQYHQGNVIALTAALQAEELAPRLLGLDTKE